MKILLRKPVKKLGTVGDVVNVKPGYARNYLIPYHLAVMPTTANLKVVEVEKAKHL
ncbi:MAG: 50S ribosomal protein L9, partial [Planctomycetota bacterium]